MFLCQTRLKLSPEVDECKPLPLVLPAAVRPGRRRPPLATVPSTLGPEPPVLQYNGAVQRHRPQAAQEQGLTLVHFSAQRKHILLHTLGA
jgi:hypothetical protein